MKKVFTFLLLFAGSCTLHAQDVYTQKQPGLIEGNFKTFSFLDQNKKSTMDQHDLLIFEDPFMTSVWVFHDPKYPDAKTTANIQKAITQELIRKGYKKVDKGADMLVSYTVFSKDGTIRGNFMNDSGDLFPDTNDELAIKKGTLLISLLARKTNKQLWHGFDKNALSQSLPISETQTMKSVTDILAPFFLK